MEMKYIFIIFKIFFSVVTNYWNNISVVWSLVWTCWHRML